MKTILTVGVFDYFHYGHLKLFERAAKLGDRLIVAVQVDEEIHKTKPDAKVLYTLDQRMEIIRALRCVDEVVPYTQVDEDISKWTFDVFAVGPDQIHPGFQRAMEWCRENGKEVITLARTPNICSSEIKKELK